MRKCIVVLFVMAFVSLITGCGGPKPIDSATIDLPSAGTHSGKVVRVGYFVDGNFMVGDQNDETKGGYAYEYLQLISGYTGWQYEYVYGSWSQLYEKCLSGEIDLMADVSYTDARAGLIGYPKSPMGHEVYYLACKSDNTTIDWNDLSTFNGKKIGVEKNSIQVKYLEKWIAQHKLDCNIVLLSSGKKNKLQALETGAIDALVMTHFQGKLNGISNVAVLGQSDYYLAVTKNRQDLLDELNTAQTMINDAHPVFLSELEYKYFPDAMVDQRLTKSEREWLGKQKEIRIGYFTDNMPFSGLDADTGKPKGLITDVMDSICNTMQIDPEMVTYVPFNDAEALKQSFSQKDIDIVFGIYKDLGWAEKSGVAETDDLTHVDICLVVSDITDTNKIKRVALPIDRPVISFLSAMKLDKCDIVFYQTTQDALDAVSNGDADCTVLNEYAAHRYLKNERLFGGLRIIDKGHKTGICMAVQKDNVNLLSVLRRGTVMLDENMINNAVSEYIYESSRYTLKDMMLEYWWLSVAIGIIFLLVLLILYIVAKSRKRISKINEVLRNQKGMLQTANDNLLEANERQFYANEELLEKNDEINELFTMQQEYIELIERNHEALRSANWVVEFDPFGEVDSINWSDGLRHILGYNDTTDFPDNLESMVKIIHKDDLIAGAKRIFSLKNDGSGKSDIIDMELRINKKDVGYIWFRAYAHLSRRPDGSPLRLYGVCQDIEEYKEMIGKMEEALLKAQQASHAKSIFLSNMSHDIRTPMNGIMGYAALAMENIQRGDQVKEYILKIQMVSKHLLSLINDILDMSRIESGRIELDPQPTNLIALVDELKSILQSDIEMNNLEFLVDTNGIYNDTVLVDRLRLKQILLNLLSNAVKFTKNGTVYLSLVETKSDATNCAKYEFHVEDTGIGIDKEFLQNIFKPFERARNSTVSGIQGTGLGMSITKSLVDMMDGDVTVTSELGKGSKFVVTLELKKCMHQDENDRASAMKNYDFSGKRVLLVDDNTINQEIALALLESVKLEADVAGNGEEAVKLFKESEDFKYDAILMDIQMPVMNGYDATVAIRGLGSDYAANVPIIAMTANAFAEDKMKALSVGMTGHIAKPIEIKDLYSTLESFIRKT